MARIHNPVEGTNKKSRLDGQLHGGMMESIDQFSNVIAKTVDNITEDDEVNQQK